MYRIQEISEIRHFFLQFAFLEVKQNEETYQRGLKELTEHLTENERKYRENERKFVEALDNLSERLFALEPLNANGNGVEVEMFDEEVFVDEPVVEEEPPQQTEEAPRRRYENYVADYRYVR